MTKLNEFLKQGSIFSEIDSVKSYPFLVDNVLLMDTLLSTNYGQRDVFDFIVDVPLPSLAQMMVMQLGVKWDKLIEIDNSDFVIGAWNGRTLKETITETETRNNTTDNVNKISAYNSDDMINNDGSTGSGTESVTGEKVRILDDSTGDISNAYNHLSLVEKNNIINVVLNDVANYLTLNIY